MRALRIICCIFVLMGPCGVAHAAIQPWWQRETAMTGEGRLAFLNKSWWGRARELKEGEHFELDLNGDGKPDTEIARVDGDIVEAIDDTASAATIWNRVSTTYVVSYGGSGVVDRMVSYISSPGQKTASEVELRYFRDGYLRYAWFGRSFGGDAADIFALKRWEYAGNDQGSRFGGNVQIYLNKYDARTNSWQPLSECPFSFWDIDRDGRTDVTLRVSAAPRESLHGPDTDYANNYDHMWTGDTSSRTNIGALNMRLSFNIDPHDESISADKPHSNFSFTMVGDEPYLYAGMRDFNPQRRLPQTTIHMPWSQRWLAALTYPATGVGFSWDEARTNFRWEGQFWIYEREYLSNTGSPTERWNMRREYAPEPSRLRQIYFSPVDQRFHLKGAREAWLEVGHLVSDEKDLEFRWWDSDGDGYLDTVEVYRGNATEPERVAHFDPRAIAAALDPERLSAMYNEKILPDSIRADEALIAAMHGITTDPVAAEYEHAAKDADAQERRRYCLDIARELLYLRVRAVLLTREKRGLYPSSAPDAKRFRDPAAGAKDSGYTLGDSLQFWASVRLLHDMDSAYAEGHFTELALMLSRVSSDEKVGGDAH
jgi:hypothetical protein